MVSAYPKGLRHIETDSHWHLTLMYQLDASLAIKSTFYHNASIFFNYFKAVLEKYLRPINSPRNGVKNVT